MDLLILAGRAFLAAVFAAAGAGKLASVSDSRRALSEFGVPHRLLAPAAILLPVAELSVAALLLTGGVGAWAARGALALLVLFAAVTVVTLVRGRRPTCRCFGNVLTSAIGWGTVVRNLLMAACAAALMSAATTLDDSVVRVLVARTGVSALAVVCGFGVVVLLVAETMLLWRVLRQHGRLLLRLDRIEQRVGLHTGAATPVLAVGAAAPPFTLPSIDGAPLELDVLRRGVKAVVLVFVNPDCQPCVALLPEVGRWQREQRDVVRTVLISAGTDDANRAMARAHQLRDVMVDHGGTTSAAYVVVATPAAVVVATDGTIARSMVVGRDAIHAQYAAALALDVDPGDGSASADVMNVAPSLTYGTATR